MKRQSLLFALECLLAHQISEKSIEQILGDFFISAFLGLKMPHPLKIQSVILNHYLPLRKIKKKKNK